MERTWGTPGGSGALGSVGGQVNDWRRTFARWRAGRPFWGGVVLAAAGLVIGYVPAHLVSLFAFIPGSIVWIGVALAGAICLCGIFAVVKPELASFFGALGMVLSILSIVGGSLGGFLVGTVLGIVGGALCMAWDGPAEG